MELCSKDCIPCCDYCIHCIHEYDENNECNEPISCSLHRDYKHQEKVRMCGNCNDFECVRIKTKQD